MCLHLYLEKERTRRASKRERENTHQSFYNFLNCILAKAFIDFLKPESQKVVKQKKIEGRNEINMGAKEKAILAFLIDVKIHPKKFTEDK